MKTASTFPILLLLAGLGGCLSNGEEAPASSEAFSLRIIGSSSVPCSDGCFEPTLAFTSEGFYVTAGREPVMWHIDSNWSVHQFPSMPSGTVAGDNLLSARATGGLHASHLIQPASFQGTGQLLGLAVHSWDGDSWVESTVWFPGQDFVAPLVDRQWLIEDSQGGLLLSYSQVGVAIWLAESMDGGRNWSPFAPFATVADRTNAGGQAGAPVRLPSGDVAIPMTTMQGLAFAVRGPDGTTELRRVGVTGGAPFPQATVFQGRVYLTWGTDEVFVAMSYDEGRTWSTPVSLGTDFVRGDGISASSPWIGASATGVFLMALKPKGPWLASLSDAGEALESWQTDARLPQDGNTDHAHFAFGPNDLPCMTWSDGEMLSLACLEEKGNGSSSPSVSG